MYLSFNLNIFNILIRIYNYTHLERNIMDSLMVLIAGGLVVKKYLDVRDDVHTNNLEDIPQTLGEGEGSTPRGLDVSDDSPPTTDMEIPITATENPPVVNVPVLPATPREHIDGAPPRTADDGTIDQYHLRTRSSNVLLPQFAENNFHRDQDANNAYFQEQFYPQDSKNIAPSVTSKPWMISLENAYNKPREESLAEVPTQSDRLDLVGNDIPARMRQIETTQVERTIPRGREKEHETPEDSLNFTANGEGRGFHPIKRYHQFLLSDNELLELDNLPRGNFAAGAGKSSKQSIMENDNTKKEIDAHYTGPASAGFFHVDGPQPSFELDPSNAESWELVEHIRAGQRGPVEKNNNNFGNKFGVAHDENINTFAAKSNSGLAKFKGGLSSFNNANSGGEKTFKNADITTPATSGALGGTRLSSISKSTIDPKKSIENLNQTSAIAFKAGSASKNKASVAKSSHIDADETFAEQESGRTRKGVLGAKAVSFAGDMILNENKEGIDFKPFTSENLVAPKNNSLPAHLRIAPTASITAFQDIALKGGERNVSEDSINSAIRGNMVVKTAKQAPKQEGTAADNRLSMILSDRMNLARKGVAPKMPANPYVLVNKIVK